MKAAVTQPNYIPWLGYFELLDQVDTWVSLDNVQFVKRSVIVRNKIRKGKDDTQFLTVSVQKGSQNKRINDLSLNSDPWWEGHLNKLAEQYSRASQFERFYPHLEELLVPKESDTELGSYNQRVVQGLCAYMGIELEVLKASDIQPELEGTAQDKVMRILDEIRPDEYYNFKAGVEAGLYEGEAFRQRRMKLFKQDYQHPEYVQDQEPFISHLSVLDLCMNHPPEEALSIIRSGRNWEPII